MPVIDSALAAIDLTHEQIDALAAANKADQRHESYPTIRIEETRLPGVLIVETRVGTSLMNRGGELTKVDDQGAFPSTY